MIFLDIITNANIKCVCIIVSSDFILCFLFGKKARWFQLHGLVNLLIVNIIKNDVYNSIIQPYHVYELKYKNDFEELYYILYLHLYHMLFFKNTMMDYFHHIVFVLFGTIPIYYFYNMNLIKLATFVGCGLPGAIEYFTLTLVKHNIITSLNQKIFITNIYNYFRYPFSIFSISLIYYNHIIGITNNISNYTIFYTMLMIFYNGGYYNKLLIENKTWHMLSIKN